MNFKFPIDRVNEPAAFERAKTLVQLFYYLGILLAFVNLIKLGTGDPGRSGFLPIWPVSWVGELPYSEASKIIFIFYLASAFFASIYWRFKLGKIIGFIGIFQIHALDSSFGNINHFFYLWLYVAFFFLFLPNTPKGERLSKEKIKKFLQVFWGAQVITLLTYSLSGTWKIVWGVRQLLEGSGGSFSPFAFSLQIANKTIIESSDFFLSDFVINNPLLVWPLYLGAIYIEFFSLWAAFKPSLQRFWGFSLIGLHVGILLVMGIAFFESILLLTILFLASPFDKEEVSFGEILHNLPLFSWLLRTLRSK